jgi:hypothetical protein
VIGKVLADGKLRDAASQQDRRRSVRTRRYHDRVGVDLTGGGRDSDRTRAVEQHAVDQCVRLDGEVVALAGRVDPRKRRIPAHSLFGHVHRMEDRV